MKGIFPMDSDAGTHEVVLVNPPAEIIREEVYDRPAYPAIGIAYVGGYLESHLAITPLMIDGKLERLGVDEVVDRIVAAHPCIVGFSAFTHMVMTAIRIAGMVRQRLPEAVLVLGGFHASFLPRRSLEEFPVIDFVVAGEGEVAFAALVGAVRAGQRRPSIPGVWYRDGDGRIVDGGRAEVPDSLDELGFAAWHLFDRAALRAHATVLPVMSQRGCPFACNFCSRPYGRTVRRRSPRHVVDEIQRNVEVFGIAAGNFYDETFTVNSQHVTDICTDIITRGIRYEWQATAHANTIDEQVVRLMKRAGCTWIGFGVESGDDDIMAAMKKGVTRQRISAAAATFRRVGMDFSAYFIIGHPGETVGSVLRSIRFAAELNPTRPAFGIMVPYPGTEIWEMAVKGQGGYKTLSTNWDDYNKQIGNAVELDHLSRRKMELLQVGGYLYCYLVHGRFKDMAGIFAGHKHRILAVLKKILFGRLASAG